MRISLILLVLFASCLPPKTYVKPEIGMGYESFVKLCSHLNEGNTLVTNATSETRTVKNGPWNYYGEARPDECVGTFTFTNNKLTSIER